MTGAEETKREQPSMLRRTVLMKRYRARRESAADVTTTHRTAPQPPSNQTERHSDRQPLARACTHARTHARTHVRTPLRHTTTQHHSPLKKKCEQTKLKTKNSEVNKHKSLETNAAACAPYSTDAVQALADR